MTIIGGGSFQPVTNWLGQSLGYQAGPGVWFGNTQTQLSPLPTAAPIPQATPVSPTFDPKIEANQLYGRRMALFAGGYARIGASPAPIVGPYLNAGVVDFIVSFGVAVPVTGDRKIYKIFLDNELAWSSSGGGTVPGDGTFAAESFEFIFKPGTLTQTVCSLESEKFPGDENAYRPQMILQIRNLPYQRFLDKTGKPVPYVACEIGDVTGGADPADGINIGDGWERIAYSPWAGYSSSTAESVTITDVADAYLLKDNFTVIALGQTIERTHPNIDLVQSDKARLKDRGSNVTPDIVFDRDSIIAQEVPIQIGRAGATQQRRELELIAIDPDQDYTAVPSLAKIPRDPFVISAAVGKETITSPLVIDASTRQALVVYTQQYEENARKKIALKVRASGYELEPGDLFGITEAADGIDDEVWKTTQTTHNADFTIEVEGEAVLRCQIGFEDITVPPLDDLGPTLAYSASRYLISSWSPQPKYTITGGAVSQAADQTGNSRHGTQASAAARPIIEAAGPLSRAAFSFDGVDDSLGSLAGISTLGSASTFYIICSFVVDTVSTNAANVFDNDPVFSDSGNFIGVFLKNNGGTHTLLGYNFDGSADSPAAHSISVGTPYVVEWHHEGGNLRTRVNMGTWNSVASGNTTVVGGAIVLGAEVSGGVTNHTDIKIVDFVTFAAIPDDAAKDELAENFMTYIGAV